LDNWTKREGREVTESVITRNKARLKGGDNVNGRIKRLIACIFLGIAILYPTYAIIAEPIERFKVPSSWEQFAEIATMVETTAMKHQISMYMLLAIQVVCIAGFTALMLTKKNG